jgi:aryl-alcohol dehydrogenase-like predicted oxidoreductase
LIAHDWSALSTGEQRDVADELEAMRDDGLVAVVGVSGYEEEDLFAALDAVTRLDVAQVHVWVIDQRLAGSEAVTQVRLRGGLLQARSFYPQGLAIADGSAGGLTARESLQDFRRFCREWGRQWG